MKRIYVTIAAIANLLLLSFCHPLSAFSNKTNFRLCRLLPCLGICCCIATRTK